LFARFPSFLFLHLDHLRSAEFLILLSWAALLEGFVSKHLRKIFLGMTLIAGLAMGAQMRPEEIEELMAETNRPKIVQMLERVNDGDSVPGEAVERAASDSFGG
jgi:hypothetical protein